ncbi:hypothetical protein B7458_07120, partial [Enterobacter hormaechei subsp. hoffmannii]
TEPAANIAIINFLFIIIFPVLLYLLPIFNCRNKTPFDESKFIQLFFYAQSILGSSCRLSFNKNKTNYFGNILTIKSPVYF